MAFGYEPAGRCDHIDLERDHMEPDRPLCELMVFVITWGIF